MKPIWGCTALTLAVCVLVAAQDNSSDRIVVPASKSGHARVVNCSLNTGTITVKAHPGSEVFVEEGGSRGRSERAQNGMRRIGDRTRGVDVEGDDSQITVHRRGGGVGDVLITVPVDTSLHLRNLSGAINVEGVHGEIDVHDLNGHITLTNVSGTVTADTQNGPIKAVMDRVDPGKPLAFSSLNGSIDLTFPADLKANLTIRNSHSSIYSDFDVTLGARAVTEKNNSPDGRFRIRLDDTIRGTINGGGVDLTIRTLNGSVYLRKK